MSLNVFVCGHSPQCFEGIIHKPFLQMVNLSELEIGKYQDNQLAEHRFFLADLHTNAEYVGVATTSWRHKYPHCLQLHHLDRLKLAPKVVYAPRVAPKKWYFLSKLYHLGSEKYLREMAEISGLSLEAGESVWSNTFICHKDIYGEFLARWRAIFDHLYAKYGTDLDIDSPDHSRRAGYLYERIATMIFANLPVEIRDMAPKATGRKLPRKFFVK